MAERHERDPVEMRIRLIVSDLLEVILLGAVTGLVLAWLVTR